MINQTITLEQIVKIGEKIGLHTVKQLQLQGGYQFYIVFRLPRLENYSICVNVHSEKPIEIEAWESSSDIDIVSLQLSMLDSCTLEIIPHTLQYVMHLIEKYEEIDDDVLLRLVA
ncbi:hypothetical protein [Mastigocoleus testarum]|uniref:Uncharacterized protein n=1 Tax=Mastigocoleus testarum BC008 TaxID=371196 RepID=A0A0V7ZL33_9CYAN|nr:hypothetical protein [Mastigocoleus testarum]KST65063.1 hypothetical protein BC008_19880 [Mastigocoleus testarum BC008]